jgi:hypothetical protein
MLTLLLSMAVQAAPPTETLKPQVEVPGGLSFLGLVQSRYTSSNVESGSPFQDNQVIGKLGGLNGTTTGSENTTGVTEFRATSFFTLAPHAMDGKAELTAGFEIDYAFGDQSYMVGGNSGGGFGADQVNLQTRRLHATLRPTLGTGHDLAIVLGQQFLADSVYEPARARPDDLFRTGGGLRFFGSEAAGLSVFGTVADTWGERLRYRVGAYSLYEQGVSEDDDVTLFVSDVQVIPEYGFRVGAHAWHLRDRSGGNAGLGFGAGPSSALSELQGGPRLDFRLDKSSPAPEVDADLFWFGVDGGFNHDLRRGPFAANAAVFMQVGGFYALELPDDTGVGWLVDAESRYRFAEGAGSELRAEVLYTSDDNPDIEGYGGVVTGNSYGIAGANWVTHGSMLLFPDAKAINRQISVVSDVSNAGEGLLAICANAGYDFVPNRFGATVGYATASDGIGRGLGTEVNARVRYQPLPLLEVSAASAMVLGADLPENPWAALLILDWVVFE